MVEGVLLILAQGLVRAGCDTADEQVGVGGRRRHHADDFAARHVDHHGTAGLRAKTLDGVVLQLCVEGQHNVSPRRAAEIFTRQAVDHAAGGIFQEADPAGLALQLLLAIGLNALLADAHGGVAIETANG